MFKSVFGKDVEVCVAFNVEGISAALENADMYPDLVITDHKMPGLNGIDLINLVQNKSS